MSRKNTCYDENSIKILNEILPCEFNNEALHAAGFKILYLIPNVKLNAKLHSNFHVVYYIQLLTKVF